MLHLGDHHLVAGAQPEPRVGPGLRLPPRKAYATRLIASVTFLVKTTSAGDSAPMNRAIVARAPSNASVASVPRVCTERATLALCRA